MLNVAFLVVNRADPDELARKSDCTAGVASPCMTEWGHSDRYFTGYPVQFAEAPGESPGPVQASSPCPEHCHKKKGYSGSDLRMLVSLDL